MKQPGITEDACGNCNWPKDEHHKTTAACPDYASNCALTGWLNIRYRQKRLVLTESVMTHMLADIDQIVTEHEMNSDQRPTNDWWEMLRYTVDGTDYRS